MNEGIQKNAEINGDELEQVAGGSDGEMAVKYCYSCKQDVMKERRGNAWYCTACGKGPSFTVVF